jgi:uncharacterized membrane protein YkoI
MRKNLSTLSAALVLFNAFYAVSAQEHRINRSQLPAAVEKTLKNQSKGAMIKGLSTDIEGGQKVYEVEMIFNGHTRDIEIAHDGTLNEVEEEVSFDCLSPEVQNALRSKAGAAKIVKVESITKTGALVAYEASTLNGSRKGEIKVGPKG